MTSFGRPQNWKLFSFTPKNCRPFDVSDEIFPRFEYHEVLFGDENLVPGPESDRAWNEELPRGGGFTVIDNPDAYGLPPGMAYADGFSNYGVSWAHQYHCVWMLRRAFFDLVNSNSSLVDVDMKEKSEEGAQLFHLSHCFGYLRQHIICNMDMTLEWPTLGGANQGIINGYEIPHQCKKRDPLDRYMEEHAPDRSLISPVHLRKWPTHQELVDGQIA